MKTQISFGFFGLLMAGIILTSNKSGPAASGNGGRTGAPSDGLCSNCHGGGSFPNAAISIQLQSGSTPVTSYMAGHSYTLKVQMTGGGQYGAQAVVLNSSNANTGTLSAPISGTRISTSGSRTYMELSARSSTGLFSATWVAPAAGTGTIKIYAAGIVCNATGGTGGDVTQSTNITIPENNNSISFSQSTYCKDGSNPTPTITGTTGGVFSSTAGLAINASTGAIDVAASTVGVYTVTYTYSGSNTVTTSVTIANRDAATIAYANGSYCVNSQANAVPTITGATGGSFSSLPAGVTFANAATGEINFQAMTTAPGTYRIIYTTNGSCPTTDTATVQLNNCTAVANVLSASSIQVFPNPNAGLFEVRYLGTAGELWLDVVDLFGNVVYKQQQFVQAQDNYRIDLGDVPNGVYWIRFQQQHGQYTTKVMISK